jgi:hypothetical protein
VSLAWLRKLIAREKNDF